MEQMCSDYVSISDLKKLNVDWLEPLWRVDSIAWQRESPLCFQCEALFDKYDIVEVNYPAYSPDLSPLDFYLFPKLKTTVKGHQFQDVEDIEKNLTAELWSISSENYKTNNFRICTAIHKGVWVPEVIIFRIIIRMLVFYYLFCCSISSPGI